MAQHGVQCFTTTETSGLFSGTTKLFVVPNASQDHMKQTRAALSHYKFRKINAVWETSRPLRELPTLPPIQMRQNYQHQSPFATNAPNSLNPIAEEEKSLNALNNQTS